MSSLPSHRAVVDARKIKSAVGVLWADSKRLGCCGHGDGDCRKGEHPPATERAGVDHRSPLRKASESPHTFTLRPYDQQRSPRRRNSGLLAGTLGTITNARATVGSLTRPFASWPAARFAADMIATGRLREGSRGLTAFAVESFFWWSLRDQAVAAAANQVVPVRSARAPAAPRSSSPA
jgi:hypothetical protein